MKPIHCSAVLLAGLIALPSLAAAHDPKLHATTTPAVIEAAAQPAVAVVEQFSKALQAADFKRVGELLAEDVLILESGGAERSREEYLGHHAISDAMFLKGAHVQVKQRVARVEGALAWVGTESELHATKDGKALTVLSTETMVLKQIGTEWRIVHIHWSSRTANAAKPETANADN
ncbi:YybH family protein [Lysobacter niastensis]|uniref:Nuclear transport factor 2 family protein n=1 Tax=Lysobacter niastensis TaxID=380629 RepID=A0ABS0BCL9_9GAMM|nr:nuclear transport factor 2 family protein [Lysobacter niastensis]MBF6024870.1 nuclear transport factor 2 family protein [Lysobacter niastensis]